MKKLSLTGLILFLLSNFMYAQEGYSSAAMSMSKQKCEHAVIPQPDEIVIEEYLNYHRHQIPQPTSGKNVNLDLQWGKEAVSPLNKEAVLQVGISTARKVDPLEIMPLNISLVIDKSGSMRQDDRMGKTKAAMAEFVTRLRPQDRVSIVTFDHIATVVMTPQLASNQNLIEQAIKGITIGGSTNMRDGIMLGYEQVLKNYKADMTNRIIILTDALTNTGVVDPEMIIKDCSGYNAEHQIDFALIGVGVDFNYKLSRQLTSSGKNQLHFIHDADDIQKVFVKEIESLLSPIGKEVYIEIAYDYALELKEVYGYEPSYHKNKIRIKLNNMNSGLSQVILLRFEVKDPRAKRLNVVANLDYQDVLKRRHESLETKAGIKLVDGWESSSAELITHPEVLKNFTIAQMAGTLRTMAECFANQKACMARRSLQESIDSVTTLYGGNMDEDVKRMLDILGNYQERLNLLANND